MPYPEPSKSEESSSSLKEVSSNDENETTKYEGPYLEYPGPIPSPIRREENSDNEEEEGEGEHERPSRAETRTESSYRTPPPVYGYPPHYPYHGYSYYGGNYPRHHVVGEEKGPKESDQSEGNNEKDAGSKKREREAMRPVISPASSVDGKQSKHDEAVDARSKPHPYSYHHPYYSYHYSPYAYPYPPYNYSYAQYVSPLGKPPKKSKPTDIPSNNTITHMPSVNRCRPLPQPIPSKGCSDTNRESPIPDFSCLVNYPDYLNKSKFPDDSTRNCVMCGKTRSTAARSKMKCPIIPRQNKGLCTLCDVTVWLFNDTVPIKWCKGCKNMKNWAAFGEKGLATKCVRCRHRQREKYASQKRKKDEAQPQDEKLGFLMTAMTAEI